MALDPVAVALKFGFLAVLYLFLLWMARSALKDLRRSQALEPGIEDATGMHRATEGLNPGCASAPRPACAPAPPMISRTAPCWGEGSRRTSASRTPSPPRSTPGWSRKAT